MNDETPGIPPPERKTTVTVKPSLRLMPLFFATGIVFFGLAILDRFALVVANFNSLLLILFLAWFLAFLMTPVVDTLHARLPRISRSLAATVVYGVVLAGMIGLVWLAAQVGAPEATSLLGRGDEISTNIQGLLRGIQDTFGIDRGFIDLAAAFASAQQTAFPAIADSLNAQFQAIASTTIVVLGNLFLVVVLSLYAVIDTDSILNMLARLVPQTRAEELDLVQRTVSKSFRGFMRTQAIMMVFQVALTLVVGLAFGLPYLFLVSALTAFVMFIPLIGPGLALLAPIGVAVAFAPDVALQVAVILFVIQTLVMNLVLPRLVHRSIGLHPILVVVALLLGAQVAGIWGAFFGIPVAAVVSILARYALDKRSVAAAEGVELDEVTAELRVDDPEMSIEEAAATAAARAEGLPEPEPEPEKTPRRWPWSRWLARWRKGG